MGVYMCVSVPYNVELNVWLIHILWLTLIIQNHSKPYDGKHQSFSRKFLLEILRIAKILYFPRLLIGHIEIPFIEYIISCYSRTRSWQCIKPFSYYSKLPLKQKKRNLILLFELTVMY